MINAYPDMRILLFTVALSFLTGLVFGLLPALRASPPDPWTTLKDTVGSIAGTGGYSSCARASSPRRWRSASSCCSAPACSSEPAEPATTETGIELDNLVTFQLSPALNGYTNERATQFYTDCSSG